MKLRNVSISVLVAATVVGLIGAASPAWASTTTPNLIRNPGAENATPDGVGGQVPVAAWKLPAGELTAVAYGTSNFPGLTDPGPKPRGKNFFAGGPDAATSVGTQTRSLTAYADLISGGTATFTLKGFLGGFLAQEDNAVLTVSFQHGPRVLSTASIGPVTAEDRSDATGLLSRSTSGTVPATANRVVITLTLTRTDGTYNDGYADALSLTITG